MLLFQPHPGSAIFVLPGVEEHYPGSFKGALYRIQRAGLNAGNAVFALCPLDRRNADPGLVGELLMAPPQEGARGAHLKAGQHCDRIMPK
jgi:hypothetical protein